MNWFVVAVGVLQFMAGIRYFMDGRPKFGLLFIMYALINVVILWCEGE